MSYKIEIFPHMGQNDIMTQPLRRGKINKEVACCFGMDCMVHTSGENPGMPSLEKMGKLKVTCELFD